MTLAWEPRIAVPLDLSPALFAGVDKGARVRRLAGETMGTSWELSLVGGAECRSLVEAVLAQVIAESSLWESGSEISRFNRAAAGARVPLSPGFAAVVGCALQLARESNGAFDPRIGKLSSHWGFGPAAVQSGGPPAFAPASLDLAEGVLTQPGGVWLDLNGIAKGQAVDRVADALRHQGVRHFLIGIGGEYRGEGVRPDGQPWWVDVEQPPGAALPPLRLALSGLSVATSGDYRRAFHRDGCRLSHSIDPRTGRPIPEGVASVAVLGKSCMLADAEATAITVLGASEGLRWATERGLAAQILLREAKGFREILTPALQDMLG